MAVLASCWYRWVYRLGATARVAPVIAARVIAISAAAEWAAAAAARSCHGRA
jgi:hypothetical protein